jgi:hypothetical protein
VTKNIIINKDGTPVIKKSIDLRGAIIKINFLMRLKGIKAALLLAQEKIFKAAKDKRW